MSKTAKELRTEARDILTANAQLALSPNRIAAETILARKGWSKARIVKALDSAVKIQSLLK